MGNSCCSSFSFILLKQPVGCGIWDVNCGGLWVVGCGLW